MRIIDSSLDDAQAKQKNYQHGIPHMITTQTPFDMHSAHLKSGYVCQYNTMVHVGSTCFQPTQRPQNVQG
jgi:hypothetical protein